MAAASVDSLDFAGTSPDSTCARPLRLHKDVVDMRSEIIENRRYFHAHPELSFKEVETAAKIACLLRSYGISEVIENVGRTGVVAIVRGEAGPGQCILLRADMDALPLPETSTVDYRSKNEGVMHACGHDGHVASLLAAAKILHASKGKLRGVVKLMFQPAEEGFGGAREMIADGLLTEKVGGAGTAVDFVYGIHLWTYIPLGTIAVSDGPIMAASDRFEISVRGKGGHGAAPQGTVDAIVEAAHLVLGLQTIVSRNRDPLDPAVITCGMIKGGHGYNIIADHVSITGTVRTFTPETKGLVVSRMHEVCEGVAKTYGGEISMEYHNGYPATVNRWPEPVKVVKRVGEAVVGADRCGLSCRTCGAEDFSYLLEAKPGAFFFVGAALPGELRPHHKSIFDFDEDALLVSASVFLHIVDHYLGPDAEAAKHAAPAAAGGGAASS